MLRLKKVVTPEIYENMPETDQDWYSPDYEKYKVKKSRSYEACDLNHTHFMGWVEEHIPIGHPYRYIKVDSFTYNMRVMRRLSELAIVDRVNSTNLLMNRVLNPKKRWK